MRMTPAFPNGVFFGPRLNVSLTTLTSRSSEIGVQSNGSFARSGSARASTPLENIWSYGLPLGAPEPTDDEHASTLLREAVVGRVDDPPLDLVAEVGQRGEHHGEVTAALAGRRLDEPVDVLEEQVA